MPILSMFYGIVIRMYFYDNKQHHTPIYMPNMQENKLCLASMMGRYLK